MLFIENLGKSRKAFFDKRPDNGYPQISVVNNIPKEYEKLHQHIQQLEIPHNNEVSFELFEFLDQEVIK